MIDLIILMHCGSNETENVLAQFVNFVLLTDVLVQCNELTKVLGVIKSFFHKILLDSRSIMHAK